MPHVRTPLSANCHRAIRRRVGSCSLRIEAAGTVGAENRVEEGTWEENMHHTAARDGDRLRIGRSTTRITMPGGERRARRGRVNEITESRCKPQSSGSIVYEGWGRKRVRSRRGPRKAQKGKGVRWRKSDAKRDDSPAAEVERATAEPRR